MQRLKCVNDFYIYDFFENYNYFENMHFIDAPLSGLYDNFEKI